MYTTLQRLERDGLVEPAEPRGDRGRIPYRLTEVGRKALETWLAEPESGPQQLREEIYLKLLLAARVADGDLRALLSRQRRVYLQQLKDLAVLEEEARSEGRDDLVLPYPGSPSAHRSRSQMSGRVRGSDQDGKGQETMTTLVELTAVSKTYNGAGARAVLDQVSLDIDGGEFTAIMGPSGSGKSTFPPVEQPEAR